MYDYNVSDLIQELYSNLDDNKLSELRRFYTSTRTIITTHSLFPGLVAAFDNEQWEGYKLLMSKIMETTNFTSSEVEFYVLEELNLI